VSVLHLMLAALLLDLDLHIVTRDKDCRPPPTSRRSRQQHRSTPHSVLNVLNVRTEIEKYCPDAFSSTTTQDNRPRNLVPAYVYFQKFNRPSTPTSPHERDHFCALIPSAQMPTTAAALVAAPPAIATGM